MADFNKHVSILEQFVIYPLPVNSRLHTYSKKPIVGFNSHDYT